MTMICVNLKKHTVLKHNFKNVDLCFLAQILQTNINIFANPMGAMIIITHSRPTPIAGIKKTPGDQT